MFGKFNEIPAMSLQDIIRKRNVTEGSTDTCNMKTVYPPQTKFVGGIYWLLYG